MLSSEENISILHGVVFGALVVIVSLGVIMYDVAKSTRTYQKRMDICAQLLTSLKTAQKSMSIVSYEIQVIKNSLSDVSGRLPKFKPTKDKPVTTKTAKVPPPPTKSQQPEKSSHRNSIVNIFNSCVSCVKSWIWGATGNTQTPNKATSITQTPETLAQTQVDTGKKYSVDSDIVKRLRKVREFLDSLCSKLDECEREFKEKLGIT